MGAILCLNCTEVLFEIELPSSAADKARTGPAKRCDLEEEDNRFFYRCPTCGAKNIVIETRTPSGFPQLTVVACSIERP